MTPKNPEKSGYAIGEMSRKTGVHIETIRYYERIGLMPKPDRTIGGNRQFNYNQLKRLSFVKKCRDLGFSLDEIRALLKMVDRDDFTCAEVHDMTMSHIANIERKLTDLKRLNRSLKEMSVQCSKGHLPECPIIETLYKL